MELSRMINTDFGLSSVLLLILGFCVSVLSGFYGIGGGWLITPLLNVLGLPMPYAIGTSLVYIIIASAVGALRHRKLKNVNYAVGLITGISALVGIVFGEQLILYLEGIGLADTYVRFSYIAMLMGVGIFMFLEKMGKNDSSQSEKGRDRAIPPPTVFSLAAGNPKKAFILSFKLILIGLFIGFLNSTMGVGGGFVLLPLFIYLVRLPVTVAVGTSLLAVLIAGFQGAIVYISAQRVAWPSVLFMSLGTIPGSLLGSAATKRIDPEKIKRYFAAILFCSGCAVVLKQVRLSLLSAIALFSIMIGSTVMILYLAYLKKNLNRENA